MKLAHIIWIISLVLLFQLNQTQILSIDFGTQFIKASLVHSGAGKSFSIVENPKSNRKFTNSIGFYNQQRLYEADTLSKRSKGPANCFIYSRILIDLHKNPSLVEVVKKDLFLQYIKENVEDQLLAKYIVSKFPEDRNELSLLEVTSMMVKYIKRSAQKMIGGEIKDVVLVVPNVWNIHQRRFLSRASQISDLYVISIITENVAASINYALSQRNTNKTETILFYNLGSNNFQMTLAEYKYVKTDKAPKPVESIFIKDDFGKSYTGGLRFDVLIYNHFVKKFEEQYKKSLNTKGMIKLLAESQKMKYVLSSNKEATIYVEGLMEGIDFRSKITRKQFQAMAEPIFKEVTSPVKRFLFDNDLVPSDLAGIQMIGGSARIPKIYSLLVDLVQNKTQVGTHINGDEAMALGSAFYGANSSKKFKVKGINLYDGFNFEMRIVLKNLDTTIQEGDQGYYFKNVTLFKKKSRFGLTKEVSFKCKQNLLIQIYKEEDGNLELLKSYAADTIKDINQTSFKIAITLEINPVSIVKINQIKYAFQKETLQYYSQKVKKVSNKTQEEKEKEQKSQVQEQEQQQKSGSQDSEKTQAQDEDQKPKKKKKAKKPKVEYQTVQKSKNVTKSVQKILDINEKYSVFSDQDDKQVNQNARKTLQRFQKIQQNKRKLVQAKNKLESLIYEVQQRIQSDQFISFAQTEELQVLKKLVEEKKLWYEDSYSIQIEDYKKQYKELLHPVNNIKKRMVENREREDVKKRALQIVTQYSKLTEKIQKGKPWITEQEVEELKQQISKGQQKVSQIFNTLIELPKNEDSIFRNKDMIKQADMIKDKYFSLKSKSKPKDYKEPEKEQDKKENKSDDEVNEDEL